MNIILTAEGQDYKGIVLTSNLFTEQTTIAITQPCIKQIVLKGKLEQGKDFGFFTIKNLFQ